MTESDLSIEKNFPLVIGGPFYKALVRLRLVEPGPNIGLRIFILVLLRVPMLGLALVQGTAFGNKVQIPLLHDFSLWGRFFVGLPLLIIAEIVIDPWITRVVATFDSSGVIRDPDVPACPHSGGCNLAGEPKRPETRLLTFREINA